MTEVRDAVERFELCPNGITQSSVEFLLHPTASESFMTQYDARFPTNIFRAGRAFVRATLAVSMACSAFTLASCGASDSKLTNDPPLAVVSRVDLSASTTTLSPSQTLQLSAVARTATGVSVPSATFAWSSSANGVVTVNATGLVTAVAAGTATISAATTGATGTVTFTVVAAGGTVSTVSVALSDPAIQIGNLAQATVSARDANNQSIPLGTRTLVWSSSNTAIATVTSAGIISGVGIGSAQLRATVTEGTTQVVGSSTLSVTSIPGAPITADVSMPGLTFSPADIVLKVNGTARFIFPAMEHNVFWRPTVTGAPADINTTSSKTVSLTFNTPGVFPFVCTLHDGMTGRVIVTP